MPYTETKSALALTKEPQRLLCSFRPGGDPPTERTKAYSNWDEMLHMAGLRRVARATGLEPATSGVTGRHSNQLSYARAGGRRPAARTAM
jgi:hypothetical protein